MNVTKFMYVIGLGLSRKTVQAQINVHVFLKPFIVEMFTYIKEAFDPSEFFSNGH